ncbi:MAG TPA: RCC1 domain-containing protein [Polyangiaceae bacterium]|nr:RCC1 domain-containing protein [Polyangiaceae bacterium]
MIPAPLAGGGDTGSAGATPSGGTGGDAFGGEGAQPFSEAGARGGQSGGAAGAAGGQANPQRRGGEAGQLEPQGQGGEAGQPQPQGGQGGEAGAGSTLPDILKLHAGGGHNCVLIRGGTVKCWGGNFGGQLGYGNVDDIGEDVLRFSVGPVSVTAAPGVTVTQLATGLGEQLPWTAWLPEYGGRRHR